ncbi:MAG: hypothetical protein R3E97_11300 [Candidatus Eisenbacteria bacterium]
MHSVRRIRSHATHCCSPDGREVPVRSWRHVLRFLLAGAVLASAATGSISNAFALEVDGTPTEDETQANPGEETDPSSFLQKAFEVLEPFYFRLGPRWLDFDSTLDDRITPVSSDYTFDRSGSGIDIAVGYDFGPRFGIETQIGGVSLSPTPEDADAFLGGAMILGLIPVSRFGEHELRLAGGLGMTMLYQNGPDFPERVYMGTAGLVGARLRLQLQRHTRLSLGADYTVQDTRWEILPGADAGDDEVRNVGGTAWIRGAFAGVEFCF